MRYFPLTHQPRLKSRLLLIVMYVVFSCEQIRYELYCNSSPTSQRGKHLLYIPSVYASTKGGGGILPCETCAYACAVQNCAHRRTRTVRSKKGGKRKLPVCECRTNPSIHPSTCAPIRCDPKTIKENSKGAASKCVRDLTYNKGKKKETERER